MHSILGAWQFWAGVGAGAGMVFSAVVIATMIEVPRIYTLGFREGMARTQPSEKGK